VEAALRATFADLGPDAARAAVLDGRVFTSGRRVSGLRRRVAAGEALVLHPPGSSGSPPPVCVLFEDDRWLVVNKPAGAAVNPSETSARASVVELFTDREARVVHRLDRETTGVLVLAKGAQAAAELSAAFAERRVDKTYLAVVEGDGLEGRIDARIGRDKRRPRARAVRPDGQAAQTAVRTLGATGGGLALLEARPLTGRTHQIRVHLAARGQPIFGDTLYGGAAALRFEGDVLRAARPLLHAARLVLPHAEGPRTFEAPLPSDMAPLVERLRA
jgi:23S rRNA pseudouridine1911/1915/1917 synthase